VFPVPQNIGTVFLLGLIAQNQITVCSLYPRTSLQCFVKVYSTKSNDSVFPAHQNFGKVCLLGFIAQILIAVYTLYPRTQVLCVC